MLLPVIVAILNWRTVVADSIQDPHIHRTSNSLIQNSLVHFLPSIKPAVLNVSYIDRGENILRVPNITKHEEKKKTFKKPRRIIQKIIKKNKQKRKTFNNNNQFATQPSQPKEDFDIYAKEELLQQKVNSKVNATTTQSYQKKQKKWNKLARYPMPFRKMNSNRDAQKNNKMYRRNRRSNDQQDLFILKDLDEIKVVSGNKDYDVVKAHLQKHW